MRFSKQPSEKPIIVCPKGDKYVLIDGQHQYAAKLLQIIQTGDKTLKINTIIVNTDVENFIHHKCIDKYAWNR